MGKILPVGRLDIEKSITLVRKIRFETSTVRTISLINCQKKFLCVLKVTKSSECLFLDLFTSEYMYMKA